VRQLCGGVAAFSSDHGNKLGIIVSLLCLECSPKGKRLVPLSVLAYSLLEASHGDLGSIIKCTCGSVVAVGDLVVANLLARRSDFVLE